MCDRTPCTHAAGPLDRTFVQGVRRCPVVANARTRWARQKIKGRRWSSSAPLAAVEEYKNSEEYKALLAAAESK